MLWGLHLLKDWEELGRNCSTALHLQPQCFHLLTPSPCKYLRSSLKSPSWGVISRNAPIHHPALLSK